MFIDRDVHRRTGLVTKRALEWVFGRYARRSLLQWKPPAVKRSSAPALRQKLLDARYSESTLSKMNDARKVPFWSWRLHAETGMGLVPVLQSQMEEHHPSAKDVDPWSGRLTANALHCPGLWDKPDLGKAHQVGKPASAPFLFVICFENSLCPFIHT